MAFDYDWPDRPHLDFAGSGSVFCNNDDGSQTAESRGVDWILFGLNILTEYGPPLLSYRNIP